MWLQYKKEKLYGAYYRAKKGLKIQIRNNSENVPQEKLIAGEND